MNNPIYPHLSNEDYNKLLKHDWEFHKESDMIKNNSVVLDFNFRSIGSSENIICHFNYYETTREYYNSTSIPKSSNLIKMLLLLGLL